MNVWCTYVMCVTISYILACFVSILFPMPIFISFPIWQDVSSIPGLYCLPNFIASLSVVLLYYLIANSRLKSTAFKKNKNKFDPTSSNFLKINHSTIDHSSILKTKSNHFINHFPLTRQTLDQHQAFLFLLFEAYKNFFLNKKRVEKGISCLHLFASRMIEWLIAHYISQYFRHPNKILKFTNNFLN